MASNTPSSCCPTGMRYQYASSGSIVADGKVARNLKSSRATAVHCATRVRVIARWTILKGEMDDIEERAVLLAPDASTTPAEAAAPSSRAGRAWQWLQAAARRLKREMVALWIASTDERVPLFAKVLATVVLALALSPFDLIPDFIPVLGLLDDLILVPLGLWLALSLVPEEVMVDARRAAVEMENGGEAQLPA
eukprot:IDg16168t1